MHSDSIFEARSYAEALRLSMNLLIRVIVTWLVTSTVAVLAIVWLMRTFSYLVITVSCLSACVILAVASLYFCSWLYYRKAIREEQQ